MSEAVDLMITTNLQSVSADLMTSKVSFATLKVENLETKVKLSMSKTEIETSLKNFRVFDRSPDSLYKMIAECTGDQVNTHLIILASHSSFVNTDAVT